MSIFEVKSFQQIVADMAAKMAAETPITDFNTGSVVLTLLEAAAQEDFQQYADQLIQGNIDPSSNLIDQNPERATAKWLNYYGSNIKELNFKFCLLVY